MSIVTKTGDHGETDGPRAKRIKKTALFTEVVGTLDELNSVLGISRSEYMHIDIRDFVREVQHRLLDIGAELYTGKDSITAADTEWLEYYVKAHEPDLDTFILPNNFLHLARSICRRLERVLLSYLNGTGFGNPETLRYINRLSDALYAAAIETSEVFEKWEVRK